MKSMMVEIRKVLNNNNNNRHYKSTKSTRGLKSWLGFNIN